MTMLADRQATFIAALLAEDQVLPSGWNENHATGFAIYRNNYRTALVDALLDTFKRTARWVGEDAFYQAAAHHLVSHPPTGWTLDDVGNGFDSTLAILFANDPEVAELAWIEWSMHKAFGATDAEPMTAAAFGAATNGFDAPDWDALRFAFMPRIATRTMQYDIAAIWHALEAGELIVPKYERAEPFSCHVYRDGEQPVFVTAPAFETEALRTMLDGASFNQILNMFAETLDAESAAAHAGELLGRWLHNKMITGIA